MIAAIMVMAILTTINTFMILLVMLSIYGKCNEFIEKQERNREAISEFTRGLIKGLGDKKNG